MTFRAVNLIANIFFAQVPCGAVAMSYIIITISAISIVCFQTPCLSPSIGAVREKKALLLRNLLIALLPLCEGLSELTTLSDMSKKSSARPSASPEQTFCPHTPMYGAQLTTPDEAKSSPTL